VDPRFFVEFWKVISLLLPVFLSDSVPRLRTVKGRTNTKFLKTNISKKTMNKEDISVHFHHLYKAHVVS